MRTQAKWSYYPDLAVFAVFIACPRSIVRGLLVHLRLLEVKRHNLRCYAHCYATDHFVLSSLYIIMASSYEYEDGFVRIVPFRLVFGDNLMDEDSAYLCLYHIHTVFYCQDAESEEVMEVIMNCTPSHSGSLYRHGRHS